MARILVVDDEPDIREFLSGLLGRRGHQVDLAATYDEALAAARAIDYDAILTDINLGDPRLGGQDGLFMLQTLGPEHCARSPAVIFTGNYADVANPILAVKLGVVDFLKKPVEKAEMLRAVDKAIERRQVWQLRQRLQQENVQFKGTVEEQNRQLLAYAQRLAAQNEELEQTYRGTVVGFAELLEGKDDTTAQHCLRLQVNCRRMGLEIPEFRASSKRLRDLELGAMLHDIGKSKVPETILRKPGALTPQEWEVMRLHPTHGASILRKIPFLAGAIPVVQNHHEKWDGSGYPGRLRGESIPLDARVFMVADAFDTITSVRPYKKQGSREQALQEIMRCAGTHFDPDVVEVFLRVHRDLVVEGEANLRTTMWGEALPSSPPLAETPLPPPSSLAGTPPPPPPSITDGSPLPAPKAAALREA